MGSARTLQLISDAFDGSRVLTKDEVKLAAHGRLPVSEYMPGYDGKTRFPPEVRWAMLTACLIRTANALWDERDPALPLPADHLKHLHRRP